MKAFEKWYNPIKGQFGMMKRENQIAEAAWKAALEFVKSQTVPNSFITESMPDTRVIDMKIIEKELADD